MRGDLEDMNHLAEEKLGWTSKGFAVLKSTCMVPQMHLKMVLLIPSASKSPWQPGTVVLVVQILEEKFRSLHIFMCVSLLYALL